MDLSFTPDQDALREATNRLYAKESHGERVREAEPTGFDPVLWAAVVAMGLPVMALPEAAGGAGASLTDLAAAVEVHGAHLGSVPLVETAVAARLLARFPDAADLLTEVVDGAPAALALRPATDGTAGGVPGRCGRRPGARPRRRAAGRGRPAGRHPPSRPRQPRPRRRRARPMHASWRRARTPSLPTPPPSTSGARSRRSPRPAWRAPASTSGSSTPRTASSSGCPSAASRRSSTASPTCTPGSTAAASSPTRPCGRSTRENRRRRASPPRHRWWCGEVADEAAGFSLHVHGGYGFMLEYDVQLHVRRAKATRLLLGDPAHELQRDRGATLGRGRARSRRRGPRRHRPSHPARHGLPVRAGDRGVPS